MRDRRREKWEEYSKRKTSSLNPICLTSKFLLFSAKEDFFFILKPIWPPFGTKYHAPWSVSTKTDKLNTEKTKTNKRKIQNQNKCHCNEWLDHLCTFNPSFSSKREKVIFHQLPLLFCVLPHTPTTMHVRKLML